MILLISLNLNTPRYFIEFYQGDHALGIFAAMAYIPTAGDMVINALGQSASPRLAQYYATGDRRGFIRLLAQLLVMATLMGLMGITLAHMAGAKILSFFYSPEFAKQAPVFVLLIATASIGYLCSLLGYSMTAIRQFRVQAPLFCWVTGITTFLCYQWIPTQGLTGAVLALMVAAGMQFLISAGILTHALLYLPSTSAQPSLNLRP